jgi:peptidyl-dipeptidase A
MLKLLAVKFLLIAVTNGETSLDTDETAASERVEQMCEELKERMYESSVVSWNHATNLTDYNEKLKEESDLKMSELNKEIALELNEFDYENFKNETLKRLISKLMSIGDNILDESDFRELSMAVTHMQANFAKIKIPRFRNKDELVSLEPEITETLISSRDPEELKYYWTEFHNAAGAPSKKHFFKYVELKNKAANLNRKFME